MIPAPRTISPELDFPDSLPVLPDIHTVNGLYIRAEAGDKYLESKQFISRVHFLNSYTILGNKEIKSIQKGYNQ